MSPTRATHDCSFQVLQQKVGVIFGRDIDLQVAFSLAFSFGFGLAKMPGVIVMTGQYFHSHRLTVLGSVMVVSMLIHGLGIFCFARAPLHQVTCVFFSTFFQSWIFGGLFSYLEGRKCTETLVAIVMCLYTFAGPASRSAARFVLEVGVPVSKMPLVLGATTCPVAVVLLYLADRSRGVRPSAADIQERAQRKPVGPRVQWQFMCDNALGLFCLILSLTLMSSLRSLREFYGQDIFTAALHRQTPPSSIFFFLVDVPGSLMACGVMLSFNRFSDNGVALRAMMGVAYLCACVLLGASEMSQAEMIGGQAWCILAGVCIYSGYGIMCGPWYDRLVAATKFEGTCTFLIFISDAAAFTGTIALLLYQIFFVPETQDGVGPGTSLTSFMAFLYFCCMAMVVLLVAGIAYYTKKLGVGGGFALGSKLEAKPLTGLP